MGKRNIVVVFVSASIWRNKKRTFFKNFKKGKPLNCSFNSLKFNTRGRWRSDQKTIKQLNFSLQF